MASFIRLVQGLMIVREYTDKFEDLYKYVKDIYPEIKIEKFKEGLHIILRCKLNLYTRTTFKGWVEKAMEQEKLEKELEQTMKVRVSRSKFYEQPGKGIESEKSQYHPYSKVKNKIGEK